MSTNCSLSPPAYTSRAYEGRTSKTFQSATFSKLLSRRTPIDIGLTSEPNQVQAYTTGDEIRGHIDLKLDNIVDILELSIILEGTSSTYVEDPSAARLGAYVRGEHTFLRIAHATDRLHLDGDNEDGAVHTVPFIFVVPDRLLPSTCLHKTEHSEVKTAHLHLPPTLGSPSSSYRIMDDLAPEMSKIQYAIKVRGQIRNRSGQIIELDEQTEPVRIVPATEEQPPILFDEEDSEFCLREVKALKRGVFPRSQVGKLVVEMAQPSSFSLPPPRGTILDEVMTMANIALRFEPHNSSQQPPRLQSISSKLHVYTFFGAVPCDVLPRATHHEKRSNLHGVYATSVKLSSSSSPIITWQRQEEVDTSHSTDVAQPNSLRPGSVVYTAALHLPLSLPNKTDDKRGKSFVPTFHSCNVSRCYSVSLCLSFSDSGGSMFSSNVKLKLPVQISSEGRGCEQR